MREQELPRVQTLSNTLLWGWVHRGNGATLAYVDSSFEMEFSLFFSCKTEQDKQKNNLIQRLDITSFYLQLRARTTHPSTAES